MPKGKWITYSVEERTWLEVNRALVISDYHQAFVELFGRADVSLKNLHSLRKREGWLTGRSGHFVKGEAPHNKGKPCPEGKGGRHPNARATQFKAGVRRGVASKLWKPVGTERVMDGYLERKINDDLPLKDRWRAVHLINWEALNGPLPEGHCLKCLDGNRMNTTPENWALIPRALLPRLNGGNRYRNIVAYDTAPSELKPAILSLAKLEHAAKQRRKRAA